MKSKPPRQNRDVPWWSLRFTQKDLAEGGFEDRERGPEAEARHRAYVQNAYATLSPTSELVVRGAQAGLQVGAAVLAVETALLIGIIVAALSVNEGSFGNLYGTTPLSGTFFEPLWPVVLSLPVLPVFSVIGVIAALMRRIGNRWRRTLYTYFNPVRPWLDFLSFWLLCTCLLIWGIVALNLFTFETDPSGVLIITAAAGGLMAWPCHSLWLALYLPMIQKHGSASMDQIRAIIERQL